VRVSCARSPHRVFDAGDERQSARPGIRRQRQATSSHLELSCRTPEAAGGPRGTVASSSARHGRLRRNAVSPHGVRLSGAPGAPLRIGCSSANRALAGKLLWDGIVAVPKVFDAGCPALFRYEGCGLPGESARSWDADERCSRPGAIRLIPLACGHTATHGGTQNIAATADIWRLIPAARINSDPEGPLYRVDGPRGLTQAAENHGRTISERHNRNPQRRGQRV
jgi:hypothetical protein